MCRRGTAVLDTDEPGDSGRILLLTAAFVAFALVLVSVVVSVTGIHLERKHLHDLADASALAAADAIEPDAVYEGRVTRPDLEGGLVLTDADVAATVRGFLEDHPEASRGLEDVRVVSATTPDGRTAEVVLAARARPVLLSLATAGLADGVVLQVRAAARAW